MAFTGKFEMESEKNYDEFMKLLGISSDVIEKARNFKIVTEVQQDGQDFTWSQHYSGGHTMTNKFTVGKESNIQTMGGKTFKATVQMEGGKLVVNFPNYHQTSEIVGDKLVEVSVLLIPGMIIGHFSASWPQPLRSRPLGSWLYQHFPCTRLYAECWMHMMSFGLQNNPVRWRFLSPF
ncbi:gastrotropin isoform X1 [Symphalangus syndactylus]|uniref:gastrotropin isoform X1 n=1 Tax=Symphalangus syndactylus TaxID=9590 RepID=UPI003005F948